MVYCRDEGHIIQLRKKQSDTDNIPVSCMPPNTQAALHSVIFETFTAGCKRNMEEYMTRWRGRQCTCNITLRRVVVEKKCVTYSVRVFVALGIQHAMRMPRIILSPVACSALQYFSTLPHKRYVFRGGGGEEREREHKMCFDFLCNFVWKTDHCNKYCAIYH